MSLLTESQIYDARREATSYGVYASQSILKQAADRYSSLDAYDIFLSHSIKDSDIVLGIKKFLEKAGFKVYVDWIEDPELDRSKVSKATAEKIQKRMKQSSSLIYAHSRYSKDSKWMPWELGYFDGYKSRVAILPISQTADSRFKGQEYLSLYPYIDVSGASLFVNDQEIIGKYVGFKEWLQGKNPK